MSLRRTAAFAFAVASLALTGCQAEVTTSLDVTGERSGVITVSARFTGEAGAVVAEDAQTRDGLVEAFKSRTGANPEMSIDGDEVTARVTVGVDQLGGLADITGVRSVSVSADGTSVSVHLVPATGIGEAVRTQTSSEPDAVALSATMLSSTLLHASVTFPGGVTDPGSGPVSVHDNTVTFTRNADDTSETTWTVQGDPTADLHWLLWGSGAAGVALVGFVLRRRRT